MTQYEYKVVDTSLTKANLEEICNKLGQKGWRLTVYKEGFLFFEREINQSV